MVLYSRQARSDLEAIREGLLNWEKIELTYEFVRAYMSDMLDVCDSLDTKNYHTNATLLSHTRYGSKIHRYRRNKQTTWYIVYDMDAYNNFYINKIVSNYTSI